MVKLVAKLSFQFNIRCESLKKTQQKKGASVFSSHHVTSNLTSLKQNAPGLSLYSALEGMANHSELIWLGNATSDKQCPQLGYLPKEARSSDLFHSQDMLQRFLLLTGFRKAQQQYNLVFQRVVSLCAFHLCT